MIEEMRNAYDLATAQKEKHEEVQEERAEVNQNLVLTGKLSVSTDRVHALVNVNVEELKPILSKYFMGTIIGSLGGTDSYITLDSLFHFGERSTYPISVGIFGIQINPRFLALTTSVQASMATPFPWSYCRFTSGRIKKTTVWF